MRIPFPKRIPLNRVALFAAALFAIQQFDGTALYFSAGCTAFVLIAALAFNVGGGLTRTAGAYVFFYSTLVVIVGLCYKAYLGEPADSNLLEPHRTIEVYVVGITTMLAAVYLSRKLSRKSGLLENVLIESRMYRSSIGCIVFGIAGPFIFSLFGEEGVRLQKAFAQLDQLVALGILIGVGYEIRSSHGTRSINLPILFAMCFYFSQGLLGYSKEGMLTPLVCWFLPVCVLRYRLSLLQVGVCILGLFVIFHYLVPYSQYGRNFATQNQTFEQRVSLSLKLLDHPNDTRKKYLRTTTPEQATYFNKPQGFWDRLQFVSVDDGLINATDQGKIFGLWPIKASFLNAIPHVIWPNKPVFGLGNIYTHEFVLNMPAEDTSTGIAYSALSEAYHWAKWTGVLIVAPLIWFLFFVVFDWLFGDLRAAPWGLLVIVALSHTAPEGMLSGLIHFFTFGAEIFVFCALFATWVAPIFAIAVLGPDRRLTTRPTAFDPVPALVQERPKLWSAVPRRIHEK